MTDSFFFLMIAGMTAVTYVPRMLPAVLIDRMKFSPRVEKFLKLIPYTAMAALIFPGILTAMDRWYLGMAGALAAGFLAWKKSPVMVCVLAAIAVEYILLLL